MTGTRALVGDIGGTKTNLALARFDGERWQLSAPRRHASASATSLEAIVRAYLDATGETVELAAFAVAGPVADDRCVTTNLPWHLDARALERELGLERVRLLNDLEAVAWAVPILDAGQLHTLHAGERARGNACVVAAGTGLGEAGLYWDGARYHPFATEGGHTTFAPTTTREFALAQYLGARFDHVSWERVASGMGVVNIHGFLRERSGTPTPDWLSEAMATGDAGAAIADAARRDACRVCVETIELFATLYGREIGNAALSHMARGGIYLAGGVTLGVLDLLERGPFLDAIFDKGRMGALVRRMPVHVIREPHAALYGAARCVSLD